MRTSEIDCLHLFSKLLSGLNRASLGLDRLKKAAICICVHIRSMYQYKIMYDFRSGHIISLHIMESCQSFHINHIISFHIMSYHIFSHNVGGLLVGNTSV